MDSKDQNKEDEENVEIEEKIVGPKGETKIRKYTRGKYLGKGGFAKCYVCTNQETKQVTAAKIIPKKNLTKSRQRAKLLSEIRIHRALKHTNVVKFMHVFEDQNNVYIQLELCKNNSLNNYIKRKRKINESMTKSFTLQIVNALKYLHANKVIHRDLKLGNLFISEEGEIKLGDFGLAAKLEFDNDKRYTVCGTPNYIAPEILENKNGHSYGVDIWSLGVIVYTLVVGKPPFETENVKETYKRIKACQYKFPEHSNASEEVRNLVDNILVRDPTKRLTLDQIIECDFLNKGECIPLKIPPSLLNNPNSTSELEKIFNATKRKDGVDDTKKTMAAGTTIKQKTQSKIESETIEGEDKEKSPAVAEEVYVKRWVDYSSKYGLGYLLSNGTSGVFFNDCTKIVISEDKKFFQYIERRASDKQEVVKWYAIDNYPDQEQLHKKVTLLQHFRSYLEGDRAAPTKPVPGAEALPIPGGKSSHLTHLKKWMRTRHAIMFRLSNKLVQVDFQDETRIKLSSESKMVTYTDKKGNVSSISITVAFECNNPEMQKRLKYTKEILTHMLSNNNNKKKD